MKIRDLNMSYKQDKTWFKSAAARNATYVYAGKYLELLDGPSCSINAISGCNLRFKENTGISIEHHKISAVRLSLLSLKTE